MTQSTNAETVRGGAIELDASSAIPPLLTPVHYHAGKELYLIPGVDMLNHSTRPERVNTALQHRKEEAAKQGSGSDADVSFTGFFAIDAGTVLLSNKAGLSLSSNPVP